MLKSISFLILLIAGVSCSSASKVSYEAEADREGIRAVFQARMKELRNCFYETLESNPAAEGKLILAFDLSPDGKAQNTRIENVKGRRGIEAIGPCLTARVTSWQFPKPAANEFTAVSYPLYFSENGRTNFDEPPKIPAPSATPNLGAEDSDQK